jgi:hypothetical protein
MLLPCNTLNNLLQFCNTLHISRTLCYKFIVDTTGVLLGFYGVTQIFLCYRNVLPNLCIVVVFADHFGGEVSSSFQIYTEIYFNVKWAMVKLFFSGLIDGMVKI